MQVFLPLRKESRCWGDRKKDVLVPVFPGFAFVRSDRSVLHRLIVLQTPGVMGFASSASTVAAVPEKQIEDLQLLVAEGISFSPHRFVRVGKRMRVRGGNLDGVEGLFTGREKKKLMVSIDAIQRSLAIDIHDCQLEVI